MYIRYSIYYSIKFMKFDISKKIKIPKKASKEKIIKFFKLIKLNDLITLNKSAKNLTVNEIVSEICLHITNLGGFV